MMEWRPIETAPKDGAIVLGYYAGTVSAMCWHTSKYYKHGGFGCADNWAVHGPGLLAYTFEGQPMVFKPTHWMPRPEPPE